jgi:hypothetical protein
MSISESSQRKLPVQWPMPGENTLLLTVAAGFLILILVAALLMPALAKGSMTPEEEALSRLCD